VTSDETLLWKDFDLECVMISCCAGAELQLRRVAPGRGDDYEIVLRELYPTKSDLYDRSRALRQRTVRDSEPHPQRA
jgi:hypothetical protein